MYDAGPVTFFLPDEFIPNLVEFPREGDEPTEPQRSRPKVLVVDDQKLVADTVGEILEAAGFDVVTAYNGHTALEEANRFRPDFLLSDVLMPRMNGVELAIAIRKMHPAARILLFSGQAGISEILLEAQKQGYQFELIAKPIHPMKLIEHLKNK
jgi:CheY-like chemotaxis protein